MQASPRRISAVDGRPFFPLGGQARNSSSYTDAESEAAFRAVTQIGGNTLEIPVDRDQMEPKEFPSTSAASMRCLPVRDGTV
jgi:hypothetical protein